MLSIRLSRVGKKKQPTYRVVVLPKTSDPWSTYLENLGSYNPRTKQAVLKSDRIKHWMGKGAEVSPSMWNLLVKEKIVDGAKRVVKIGKKKAKKS